LGSRGFLLEVRPLGAAVENILDISYISPFIMVDDGARWYNKMSGRSACWGKLSRVASRILRCGVCEMDKYCRDLRMLPTTPSFHVMLNLAAPCLFMS
jgi:hypothetical protein